MKRVKQKRQTGVKFIPTSKIKEILADSYLRGNGGEGKCYEHSKQDLEEVLYAREQRELDKLIDSLDNIPEHIQLFKG